MLQDYAPYIENTAPSYLIKTQYINSEEDAYVKFLNSDIKLLGWLNGCGNMVCTGNLFIKFILIFDFVVF